MSVRVQSVRGMHSHWLRAVTGSDAHTCRPIEMAIDITGTLSLTHARNPVAHEFTTNTVNNQGQEYFRSKTKWTRPHQCSYRVNETRFNDVFYFCLCVRFEHFFFFALHWKSEKPVSRAVFCARMFFGWCVFSLCSFRYNWLRSKVMLSHTHKHPSSTASTNYADTCVRAFMLAQTHRTAMDEGIGTLRRFGFLVLQQLFIVLYLRRRRSHSNYILRILFSISSANKTPNGRFTATIDVRAICSN